MFIGVAPAILRLPLTAILKPQDVIAILAQPANAMQAAINALPFSPDILIGKDRVAAGDWAYRDSLRGLNLTLASNTTAADAAWPGYSGTNNRIEYAFKQTPGVVWRVTWTGDSTSNRQIPHGLGVVPGMAIARRRDAAQNWFTTHRSLSPSLTSILVLNDTGPEQGQNNNIFPAASTATTLIVGAAGLNVSGATYVAYLFAHDPSADGIVQCGIYNGSANTTVNLGWRPQFLLLKSPSVTSNWFLLDSARGFQPSSQKWLQPNTSGAEGSAADGVSGFTNTGFVDAGFYAGDGNTVIYLAIRAPY